MYNILHRYQKPWPSEFIDHSHPLAKGLVGAWIMNEGAGNKAFDASGNINSGDLLSGTKPIWTPGGLDFGTIAEEKRVDIQSKLSNFSGSNSTILFRCAIRAWDANGFIFFGTNTGANVYWFFQNNGDVRIHSVNQGAAGTATFDDGIYRNYAMTHRVTGGSFYVNGEFVVSGPQGEALPSGAKNFQIGRWIGGNDWTLDGIIEYLYVYNRDLPPTEIKSIHIDPYQMWGDPMLWLAGAAVAPVGNAPTGVLYGPLSGVLDGPI
ncbi:hypothetical protein LCGC14_2370410 [marine sediment metagenome]|uniref:LamG-like jellyroll fold domain-containing protein n=1 Tax=marine sediment metagenome TaxID=412755 RepID=A0A0F9EYM0_9ZZZZ